MSEKITAATIVDRLIAISEDKIWATELALPPWRERRIDFWTLEPIGSKGFRASSYEIKVSRSDFIVVSLVRNCGRTRRDMGLIMAQLGYLQNAEKRRDEQSRHRMQWQNDRWLRKAQQQTDAAETPPYSHGGGGRG